MNDNGTSPRGPGDELPLEDVGRLVELLAESGVGEIRVRQGELEITVKAKPEAPAAQPAEQRLALRAETIPGTSIPEERLPESLPDRDVGLHLVRSPVVGTFYRAPAPGEGPYVEAGDRVKAGQTLCIVEAMKLMNEIPADASGELVEIMVENAKGVEYDQPLFRIRPETTS